MRIKSGTLNVTTPTDREIVMTRTFDAPRPRVFAAWTQPDLMRRWMGAEGWQMTECEVDLRVGGAWRYRMRRTNGREMEFRGTYREVVAPERVVSVESAGCDVAHASANREGDAAVTTTIVLTEENGETGMTMTLGYLTQEIRDARLKTGALKGLAESYEKLDGVLRSPG